MAGHRSRLSITAPGAARICHRISALLNFIMMLMFSMIKRDLIRLMSFPAEWDLWGLYPDELFELQLASSGPGNENASEHHPNGAFHWWLRQDPSALALGCAFFTSSGVFHVAVSTSARQASYCARAALIPL